MIHKNTCIIFKTDENTVLTQIRLFLLNSGHNSQAECNLFNQLLIPLNIHVIGRHIISTIHCNYHKKNSRHLKLATRSTPSLLQTLWWMTRIFSQFLKFCNLLALYLSCFTMSSFVAMCWISAPPDLHL